MSPLADMLSGAVAVLQRDWRIFVSYRLRFIGHLLTAFFSLTLFYYISRLVQVEAFESSDAYYAFAVVGLIILQVLNSTLSTPSATLRTELVAGTFERIVLSPTGAVRGVIATMAFPFAYALALALVMLSFAAAVFGLDVQWDTLVLAIPLGALGALSFAPFGLLILATVIVVKQAAAGATWVVAGISLIAGLYFPVTLLPEWVQWMSDVQPFTPAVDMLRNVIVGTPLREDAWIGLAKMIGFSAILFPLGVVAVRLAVQAARRRGTIIEY